MTRIVSFLVAATLASPALVTSFTSSPLFSTQRTALSYPPVATVDLLRATMPANGETSAPLSDNVIKALEKKEAKLDRKRAEAMAQLNQLEVSLNQVQSQKQEYLNGLELEDIPPGGVFSETTMRSAVKAFLWRIIAGSVTFVTSLRFSGSLTTALTIVGSDFFSKAFTMFIGERLMNKSSAGRKSGQDAASRSLIKALVWRLFAICNTLTMAIFISKDISMASKIAGSDAIFKTGLMFFYERAWARIDWGKKYDVGFSI